MDDRRRLTCWLTANNGWLEKQKKRIEIVTHGMERCQVVTRDDGTQALYYTNGYYWLGQWIPDKYSEKGN